MANSLFVVPIRGKKRQDGGGGGGGTARDEIEKTSRAVGRLAKHLDGIQEPFSSNAKVKRRDGSGTTSEGGTDI